MEQIQQHEWMGDVLTETPSCLHCWVEKFTDRNGKTTYRLDGGWYEEEPVCITRYPEQNTKENETDNADSSR